MSYGDPSDDDEPDPGISPRDHRLITITALAVQGQLDRISIHFDAALFSGELTGDELRQVVDQVSESVGWPVAAELRRRAQRSIRRHARSRPGRA